MLVLKEKELSDKLLTYQRELSRLGVENNNLHLELMNIKEVQSSSQEKWRVTCKRLENECEDLKALSSIQQHKYSELETERDNLKFKLDKVLIKMYNPTKEKGLKDPSLSLNAQNRLRRQEFKITGMLNESEDIRGFSRSQQEWAQEFQNSDERIKRYQEQVEELIIIKEDLQEEIKRFQVKLNNRDNEIQRLMDILNSGEFALKAPTRVEKVETSEKIHTLNERLDFINGEYMKMEQELIVAKQRLSQVGNVHEERDLLLISLDDAKKEIAVLKELVLKQG